MMNQVLHTVLKASPLVYQLGFFAAIWLLVLLVALSFLISRIVDRFRRQVRRPVAAPAPAKPTPWEIIVEMEGANSSPPRSEHLVLSSKSITIGRSESADLKLTDEFTSSIHATIKQTGDSLILEDQGSTNGTFVNDLPVTKPVQLKHGDVIRIGKNRFLVQ